MDMGPQEPGGGQRPGERWGNGVARAATLIGVLSAVSLLLGFVRDVVIAAVFGASAELDAYLVAQGLMNVVLGLVAGALAKAVVPVVAPAVASGRPEGRTGASRRRSPPPSSCSGPGRSLWACWPARSSRSWRPASTRSPPRSPSGSPG